VGEGIAAALARGAAHSLDSGAPGFRHPLVFLLVHKKKPDFCGAALARVERRFLPASRRVHLSPAGRDARVQRGSESQSLRFMIDNVS
jgi:hypothetical protein